MIDKQELASVNAVLLSLLADCAAVLRTIEPDDRDEADNLHALLGRIERAMNPNIPTLI